VARLRRAGSRVVAFEPTREDREVMGLDPLDPARRAPVAQQVYERVLASLAEPELRGKLAPLSEA
jgi:hypothetical protein